MKVKMGEKTLECPLCNNKNEKRFKLVTDRLRDNIRRNVFRCLNCSFIFLENKKTEKQINNFYKKEYKFIPNYGKPTPESPLTMDQKRFALVKPFLNSRAKLLDIGCGTGNFLRMAKPLVKEADGIELNEYYARKLRKERFTVYNKPLEELCLNKRYDIICIFATLEHIVNLDKFLTCLNNFMHKDSRIFIDVPNVMDALVSFYDIEEFRNFYFRNTHLYYFNTRTLRMLMEKFGYEARITPLQCFSLTNHLNWIYLRRPQRNLTIAFSSVFFANCQNDKLTRKINKLFVRMDRIYRHFLIKNEFFDVIWCEAKLRR